MPSRPWRILPLVLIPLIVILAGVRGSSAQTAYTATLSTPDTAAFPHLTALLDVHDPSGAFVHGLTPPDVTLLENNLPVPLDELVEQSPGVQFAVAVTPGDSFNIRDGMGVSRYEYLLQALNSGVWPTEPSGVDDYSLLTGDGPQVTHSSDPSAIYAALEAYQPQAGTANPGLEILSGALQLVSDPTARPGMERAILFITPPQPAEVSLGLQSIISTANQQGIRVYVWMVAAHEMFELPEANSLRNLAEQTGGSFFGFSQSETLPDIESLLEPLRYVYQLSYTSQVSAAGPQQVAAQVAVGSDSVTTQPQSFEVNLQAPQPALLSLPTAITRTYTATPAPGEADSGESLMPEEQLVEIKVTFPDGYERPLTRTSLYIDGALYAENIAAPFEQFTWDLRPYTTDSIHTLKVEAADEMGMVGSTAESVITITVPTTTQGIVSVLSQKGMLLVGVVVVVSASILGLVLVLAGRIQPRPHPGQVRAAGTDDKTRPSNFRERRRQLKDPVTQPVKITPLAAAQASTGPTGWKKYLPWLKKKETPILAIAYLLPLVNSDEPTLPAPLQILTDDVNLGTDPQKASLVVADPSIEALHARLHHENGQFRLTDAGSVAGTWVNFNKVSEAGTLLEHADIIHLGAVGFRFNFAHPPPPRKIIITPLEPEQ